MDDGMRRTQAAVVVEGPGNQATRTSYSLVSHWAMSR